MTVEKIKGKVFVTINGITKTVTQWAQEHNLNPKTLKGRIDAGWSEEHLFDRSGIWKPIAKFNEHYFDIIDDEHKAYWLGFIWSDGYLGYRIRDNGREEYNLKLSLMKSDYHHLEKFNNDLNGHYKVHYYNYGKSAFNPTFSQEARLFITNKYLGEILRNKYGIIPYREDCSKVIQNIPDDLISHFIRGVIDADGTFCHYTIQEEGYTVNKYTIHICGTEPMLRYIEQHLIQKGLINNIERKLYKRHEENGRDERCRALVLSSRKNVIDVLNYLYDNSDVYLDRKYKKYEEILNVVEV